MRWYSAKLESEIARLTGPRRHLPTKAVVAVGAHHGDFELSVPPGDERHRLTVRGPGWMEFTDLRRVCQSTVVLTVRIDQPQIAVPCAP